MSARSIIRRRLNRHLKKKEIDLVISLFRKYAEEDMPHFCTRILLSWTETENFEPFFQALCSEEQASLVYHAASLDFLSVLKSAQYYHTPPTYKGLSLLYLLAEKRISLPIFEYLWGWTKETFPEEKKEKETFFFRILEELSRSWVYPNPTLPLLMEKIAIELDTEVTSLCRLLFTKRFSQEIGLGFGLELIRTGLLVPRTLGNLNVDRSSPLQTVWFNFLVQNGYPGEIIPLVSSQCSSIEICENFSSLFEIVSTSTSIVEIEDILREFDIHI